LVGAIVVQVVAGDAGVSHLRPCDSQIASTTYVVPQYAHVCCVADEYVAAMGVSQYIVLQRPVREAVIRDSTGLSVVGSVPHNEALDGDVIGSGDNPARAGADLDCAAVRIFGQNDMARAVQGKLAASRRAVDAKWIQGISINEDLLRPQTPQSWLA